MKYLFKSYASSLSSMFLKIVRLTSWGTWDLIGPHHWQSFQPQERLSQGQIGLLPPPQPPWPTFARGKFPKGWRTQISSGMCFSNGLNQKCFWFSQEIENIFFQLKFIQQKYDTSHTSMDFLKWKYVFTETRLGNTDLRDCFGMWESHYLLPFQHFILNLLKSLMCELAIKAW